jgi:3-phenylpropionate/trans-cinnamate dioxygenase ferredoxin reductase component
MPGRIVVVGASVAGFCAAQQLRRLGFDGELCLVGDEDLVPYDRPPLSKELLRGDREPGDVALAGAEELEALGLDLRLGQSAVALDTGGRSVVLGSGERLRYDAAVLATGARARRPAFVPRLDGVHLLRTLGDALAIRADIEGRRHAVVVGAGFIGTEVAASLRACGLAVTLVDPLPAPLAAVVGETVGGLVAGLHARHGVRLEMGVGVAALEGAGRVGTVVLADGRRLPADLVVVGLGAEPNTGWLERSGLELAGGVVCDEAGAAGPPGVYAIGDVSRWRPPGAGGAIRFEHWTNAREQAGVVAANLLAGAPVATHASLPTFWSDQYDWRIQMIGTPSPGDAVRLIEGDPEQGRFAALYGRDGHVAGVLTVNSPRALVRCRALVAGRTPWAEAIGAAAA